MHLLSTQPWPGTWVADRLGVRLETQPRPDDPLGITLHDLVGLAVRDNPRRAHLLVSTVLGKHVPTDPRLVDAAGLLLGHLVAATLAGRAPDRPAAAGGLLRAALAGDAAAAAALRESLRGARPAPIPRATVIGYAETATALGHCVADALGAPYLHSTRRPVAGAHDAARFEEEHSHATSHLLLPEDPGLLRTGECLVLVDDELSTGRTALNTIRALHAAHPRSGYVVAALTDLRRPEDDLGREALAAELAVPVEVVSLASGRTHFPVDVPRRAERLVAERREVESRRANRPAPRPRVRRVDLGWPEGLPEGGRHGFTEIDRQAFEDFLPIAAARLTGALGAGRRVHVLGFEELMYAPMRLAAAVADRSPERAVTFSTTTRSPVLVVDEPDYAIRSALEFPAHDDPADGPGRRFAYNLGTPDTVVLVVDTAADTPALHADQGLLHRLGSVARDVVLVTLPVRRPAR